jgi:DNA-binding NtrC family response regulator
MLLVVDDDPIVLRLLGRQLGDRPAMFATSASEAREMARSRPLWHGFLIDIGLPEGPMAGLELLEWLSDHDGGAERIIITGRPPSEIAGAEARLDATIIPKPFDAHLLARAPERCDGKGADDPVAALVARAKEQYGFTQREADLCSELFVGWLRELAEQKSETSLVERSLGDVDHGDLPSFRRR